MGDSLEPRRSAVEPVSAGGPDTTKAPDSSSGVHNATTRVTIAWPFSQIKLEEASAELTELAGLLSDVIEALSGLVPEDRLRPLRDRTESLRARLR
jgi:glutamate-1-semialdehyde aminotransferase